METFGSRLRALRTQRNETQEELGDDVGANSGTVSRWERDDGMPHAQQLVTLANHFAVSLDYLLLGQGTEHPVALPEFDAFLQTEYGRIAQERGYIRALLAMRYPYAPTQKLYKALVSAMMLEDNRK